MLDERGVGWGGGPSIAGWRETWAFLFLPLLPCPSITHPPTPPKLPMHFPPTKSSCGKPSLSRGPARLKGCFTHLGRTLLGLSPQTGASFLCHHLPREAAFLPAGEKLLEEGLKLRVQSKQLAGKGREQPEIGPKARLFVDFVRIILGGGDPDSCALL